MHIFYCGVRDWFPNIRMWLFASHALLLLIKLSSGIFFIILVTALYNLKKKYNVLCGENLEIMICLR